LIGVVRSAPVGGWPACQCGAVALHPSLRRCALRVTTAIRTPSSRRQSAASPTVPLPSASISLMSLPIYDSDVTQAI
jgi:hypothetical protein